MGFFVYIFSVINLKIYKFQPKDKKFMFDFNKNYIQINNYDLIEMVL